MYPDELFYKSLKQINKPMKVAFLSCFIAGLIAHFYMITNKLPNYDDINCLTTYGSGVVSGRFTLAAIGKGVRKLVGNYSLPWLYGLMTIFFISIAASAVVQLLNVRRSFNCFLVGALMIVSPAVTGTFFFMFTAPYYAFSILLSLLTVWIVDKCPKRSLGASIILALGIGIYQAYMPFTAGIFLLILFQRCLKREDYKKILKSAFNYILVLILGLVIYMILNKVSILLLGQELASYQGLNEMGKISIREFSYLILIAYKNYLLYVVKDLGGMNPYPIVRLLMILLHILILICIVSAIKMIYKQYKGRQARWLIAGIVISIILFPIAVNAIYIISNKSNVYSIMLYPTVLILILMVMLLEELQMDNKKLLLFGLSDSVRKVICWSGSCILLFIISTQIYYTNVQYLAMHMQYEQAYSYFSSMITQIKMAEGFTDNLPLVIIGDTISDSSFYKNDYFDDTLSGRSDVLINVFSRNEFLKIYMGFNPKIEKDTAYWSELPEVKAMGSYPLENSIRIINDTIVLKLSD